MTNTRIGKSGYCTVIQLQKKVFNIRISLKESQFRLFYHVFFVVLSFHCYSVLPWLRTNPHPVIVHEVDTYINQLLRFFQLTSPEQPISNSFRLKTGQQQLHMSKTYHMRKYLVWKKANFSAPNWLTRLSTSYSWDGFKQASPKSFFFFPPPTHFLLVFNPSVLFPAS